MSQAAGAPVTRQSGMGEDVCMDDSFLDPSGPVPVVMWEFPLVSMVTPPPPPPPGGAPPETSLHFPFPV